MKRTLFAIIIGSLPVLIATHQLGAQTVALNTHSKNLSDSSPAVFNTSDLNKSVKETGGEKEQKMVTRMTRSFHRYFRNVVDVKWKGETDKYVAFFIKDGNRNMAWYNKKGKLINYLCTYDAQKLPKHEQAAVKRDYPGYSITFVNEVHQDGMVVYIVHIENEQSIKWVTVHDGETNLYRQFNKSK